jgi:hypothetical protein
MRLISPALEALDSGSIPLPSASLPPKLSLETTRLQGKLPFEFPSSMEAVKNQKADVPYDSENPLAPFGFGLSYGP